MPFTAIAITFAAFDWLMSLNPTWFSTVFGVYYFAGSFGAALSLLAIVTWHANIKNVFGGGMNIEHTHSIGKLMLAFTCFWTYIAFSQLMLIWIAGLPEETPFYITRFKSGWAGMGIFLILGHFFIPFGALLSRSLKRNPQKARGGWGLDPAHSLHRYLLAGDADAVPRGGDLALDAAAGVCRHRPAGHRFRGFAPARPAAGPGSRSLPA